MFHQYLESQDFWSSVVKKCAKNILQKLEGYAVYIVKAEG